MTFPGQIRVTVIREFKAIETATELEPALSTGRFRVPPAPLRERGGCARVRTR